MALKAMRLAFVSQSSVCFSEQAAACHRSNPRAPGSELRAALQSSGAAYMPPIQRTSRVPPIQPASPQLGHPSGPAPARSRVRLPKIESLSSIHAMLYMFSNSADAAPGPDIACGGPTQSAGAQHRAPGRDTDSRAFKQEIIPITTIYSV